MLMLLSEIQLMNTEEKKETTFDAIVFFDDFVNQSNFDIRRHSTDLLCGKNQFI
jgi:hypothetical protein